MEILFDGDRPVSIGPGESLLEASLRSGIPHAHACGGNGRCSTCRVAVLDGLARLEPPNEAERALTARRGFPCDIRLACQTRLVDEGAVRVRRLIRDDEDLRLARGELSDDAPGLVGQERALAVLFADIRGFTGFSEANLAYDVVHVLNRYYARVGGAIVAQGGYLDKLMGDGLMALFGLADAPDDSQAACRSALEAAVRMLGEVAEFNAYLGLHFGTTFRIGVGIHFGEVIVGRIGLGADRPLTAIGDVVNTASRLEGATKELGAPIVVSEAVWRLAGPGLPLVGRGCTLQVRGRLEPLPVVALTPGADAVGEDEHAD